MATSIATKVALVAAKLAVTTGLIWLALRGVSFAELLANLNAAQPVALAAILAAALVIAPLQAARWVLVIAGAGWRMGLASATQMVYIGYFFSQALPSSIGGDAVRMWCAWRAGLQPGGAFSTVVFDRALGLCAQVLIILATLPWLLQGMDAGPARSAVIGLAAAGAAGLIALGFVLPRLSKRAPRGVLRPFVHLAQLALRIAAVRRGLLPLALLAGAGTLLSITVIWLCALGIGANLGWLDCLVLVTPVILVSTLPVSVAGWGVRESAMILALGYAQIGPAAAFTVSVLYGLATAAASLPGLWFWLRGGYHLAEVRAAASFDAEDVNA